MSNQAENEVALSSLPGFSTVEDILKHKSVSGCTMVRRFSLLNSTEEGLFKCDLILEFVHDHTDSEAARFEFEEVHGLKISETHQISGLAIKDIASRGWDRTRYEIYDYEGDVIQFYCRSIKLSRVPQ